jgi:hypothetical protein
MKIRVSDPFEAAKDPELPTLALALDPVQARQELKRGLPRLSGDRVLRLKAIRVKRYKPGRRCVVEYKVEVQTSKRLVKAVVIGKLRARRFGAESLRLLERLWESGFDSESADGISVPEPLGLISRFQMWFQRKVPGELATERLASGEGIALSRRIAEAAHKMHKVEIPTERRHTIQDELNILGECLQKVGGLRPEWANRLSRLMASCGRLGASLPEPRLCGIHRDFYPAQVIVGPGQLSTNSQPSRIHLIDFDLYCLGDPALDIGNFIGHMTEWSLRKLDNPEAFAAQEEALEERFVELEGEPCRTAISAYKTLTLARHIYLSTQFPERQAFTPRLLELCEQRLAKKGLL